MCFDDFFFICYTKIYSALKHKTGLRSGGKSSFDESKKGITEEKLKAYSAAMRNYAPITGRSQRFLFSVPQ
jgi:hypothetical protein